MASERPRPLPAPTPAAAAPIPGWNTMIEFGREWVPVSTEAFGIVLQGLGQMSQLQVKALHDVLSYESGAADRLRRQPDPMALANTQMDWLRFAAERMVHCWMELAGAAGEMQSELAACSGRLVSTEDLFAGMRMLRT